MGRSLSWVTKLLLIIFLDKVMIFQMSLNEVFFKCPSYYCFNIR